MKLRSRPRIDYSVYDDSGDKVGKIDQGITTKMGDKVLEELKVVEDIFHSIDTYRDVEDFDTIEEIEEGVAILNQLGQQYRHLHVEFRAELGNEAHGLKYPNYKENVKYLSDFAKNARKRMKVIREEAGKIDPEANQKFSMLRVSRDVLDMKIKICLTALNMRRKSGKRFPRKQKPKKLKFLLKS